MNSVFGSSSSATNTLHDIDKSTQEVLDLIIEAQAASGAASPGIIRFGDDLPTLNLQRQVRKIGT